MSSAHSPIRRFKLLHVGTGSDTVVLYPNQTASMAALIEEVVRPLSQEERSLIDAAHQNALRLRKAS